MDRISGKKRAAPVKAAKSAVSTVASKEKKDDKAAKSAPVAETKKVRGPLAKEGAGDAYRILVHPVNTEKTTLLRSANQYVFAVAISATKVDVARAIRDLYGVKPTGVRIMKSKGKQVRFGRFSGKEKDVKKAIITLKQGETISE